MALGVLVYCLDQGSVNKHSIHFTKYPRALMLFKIALFLKDSKIWNIASKRMPEAGQVDV